MKYRVLITAPYFQPVVANYLDLFKRNSIETVVPPVEERLSASQLLPLVSDIDGAICGDDQYNDEVLSKATRLRVIAKWGTGVDSIDREACRRRGIKVCNTPNAFTEPVADTTLGYMLCFARQLHLVSQEMKTGRWFKLPGRALRECTVGLIGIGNIGRAVGKRLSAFGARILATDPVLPPASFTETYRIEMVSKARVLSESDLVSLHCDLNATTFHIIDAAAIRMMKRGAYLINTARGKLVDEPQLVKALQDKHLAGAALDVFEDEPLPNTSPLLRMNNVLLSPHNSNSSPEAWERVHRNTVDNLISALCGSAVE
jgi:phosphoglycerate dehydrogenase-like enzyme